MKEIDREASSTPWASLWFNIGWNELRDTWPGSAAMSF
jgi:hypothetical protein